MGHIGYNEEIYYLKRCLETCTRFFENKFLNFANCSRKISYENY